MVAKFKLGQRVDTGWLGEGVIRAWDEVNKTSGLLYLVELDNENATLWLGYADNGKLTIRKESDLTLAPDLKLEAARKLVEISRERERLHAEFAEKYNEDYPYIFAENLVRQIGQENNVVREVKE